MRTRLFLSVGLVTLAILMHAGCEPAPCSPGLVGPIDNRDRKAAPFIDHDWLCFKPYDGPRPSPVPDLGGDKPADEPGPKDMDAVAKAAVFVESCVQYGDLWDRNINARIDKFYSTIPEWSQEQAISERVHCFQNKTNGCDAVRECLGIVYGFVIRDYPLGCDNGIGTTGVSGDDGYVSLWLNCTGLGLECFPGQNDHRCDVPREKCPAWNTPPFCTEDNAPRTCRYSSFEPGPIQDQLPSCSKFGLTCAADATTAFCTGSGPSCESIPSENLVADFGVGIACDDADTLRACINGHEQIVHCPAVAVGLHCIDGERPHCAADFQCNYDRKNPRPTCNGTVLEICNAGVLTQVDCKSLGFATCDPFRGICEP